MVYHSILQYQYGPKPARVQRGSSAGPGQIFLGVLTKRARVLWGLFWGTSI